MSDQYSRTIAWLQARIEASRQDAEAHPQGHGNRAFYQGQAVAYESALSALLINARLLAADRAPATEVAR
ncbi:hypothetical protein [Methylobacterium pseudosasicola]|uniref:Uncharacterized protein n=1 Tax=Methylobacterium pseudosasicola TaxID=582667 RepID=A0A1I4V7E7_9HYPH|nr:hypothetical protein [Methylobacterium pseudosasicola]SFM97075.1 hypothetical protein SAMN05192568_108910 [Methylobacterium pseudosasicola]